MPPLRRAAIASDRLSPRKALFFHRDVAILIGGRTADDGNIDREGAIKQKFLARDFDELDQRLLRMLALFCAALARINKGAETDLC